MNQKTPLSLISMIAIVLILILSSCTKSTNWPQFRGPSANMVEDKNTLPETWSVDKGVKWTYDINGTGWSSPVIWGNNIFIVSTFPEKIKPAPQMGLGVPQQAPRPVAGQRQGPPPPPPGPEAPDTSFKEERYQWNITCIDLISGNEIWKKTAFRGAPRVSKHQMNTYASETPVTDGERVYAYFGMTGLYCYDMKGNLLWQNDLGGYTTQNDWGTGSSPVLDGDLLFVQVDNEVHSFVVAFDAATGNEKWRTDRDEKTNYSTPLIWKNNSRKELIVLGKTIKSYDPATGKELWSMKAGGQQVIPSPVANGDILFAGNEGGQKKAGLFAIKAGATGDITPPDSLTCGEWISWMTKEAGVGAGSPLVYNGLIYNLGGRGELTVISAADGKPVYKTKINGMAQVWATPWASKGKIFIYDEKGITRVIKAGNNFELIGENKLEDKFWASVAIAGDKLIFRGEKKLWCICR
jgi:outer membrane protein assembly factor BamB